MVSVGAYVFRAYAAVNASDHKLDDTLSLFAVNVEARS